MAIYGLNKENPGEQHPADPFNHKWQAEEVLREWLHSVPNHRDFEEQAKESPEKKSLSILRPTVIFDEENRGNVYNLFKQIVDGKFVMVGKGRRNYEC